MNIYSFNFYSFFSIEVNVKDQNPLLTYILDEWQYLLSKENINTLGKVNIVKKVNIPKGSIVLENNKALYDQSTNKFFILHHGSIFTIEASKGEFTVDVEKTFEPSIAFYLIEVFVRLYSSLYKLVFLHSSAFQYNGKNYIINAFGGTGKTNLLLDVLKDKGIYFADDLSIVDDNLYLYPYLKKLNLLDYNFAYRPDILKKLGKSLNYLKVIKLTSDFSNIFFRKINQRLRSIINIKVDHKLISEDSSNNLKKEKIDFFIWMERTEDETQLFDLSAEYFSNRMITCLDIENRHIGYIIDYMKIVNINILDLQSNQNQLIEDLSKKTNIIGIKKKTSDEKQVLNLIKDLINE